MIWSDIAYYLGFVLAIALCWRLGRIFYVPMVLDLAFDISLRAGVFSHLWLKWVMVSYSFALFVWVLALSGAFTKTSLVFLLLIDLAVITQGIWTPIQSRVETFDLAIKVSESIWYVWLTSVVFIVLSTVYRSTIGARAEGRMPDLFVNPKRRFLLPIGTWAAIIVLPTFFESAIPAALLNLRFIISAQLLVWGWVFLELPHVLREWQLFKSHE